MAIDTIIIGMPKTRSPHGSPGRPNAWTFGPSSRMIRR